MMTASRRDFLVSAGSAAVLIIGFPARAVPPRLDRMIVIDGLGSGPDDPDGKEGVLKLSPRAVAQLRASGVAAIQVTVSDVGNQPTAWDATLNNIAMLNRVIDANPDIHVQAHSAAAIKAAKTQGKVALIYGTQDTAMVGTQLDRIDTLAGLGVRVVQLTYNLHNLSGDGALEPANAGLSKLGRATIERIEAAKLLLDLSHGGQRTIAEAITAAKRPMTISHTGCRSLHDNPRNVWDAELRAMADKGGVVGIYWMPFLVPDSRPAATDLVRHMRHAVDVCGEDHVAVGTDGMLSKTIIDAKARAAQAKFFADRSQRGIAAPGEGADIFNIVTDLDSHMRFHLLADALDRDGWSTARIEKILGANLLRLYSDAWGG